jgi:hypothetical protein
MPEEKTFPSIESLFSESFETFKKAILKLFLVNVLSVVFSLFIFLIGLIIFVITLIVLGISFSVNSMLGLVLSVPFVIFVIAVVIITLLIGMIFKAAIIFTVNNPVTPFSEILRKSLKPVLPLFALGIISFLLIAPTVILFIFPAIIVGFFFSLAAYELVLHNKGVLSSLRRSVYVIKTNFWEVFLRALLFAGISVIYGLISLVITLPLSLLKVGFIGNLIMIVPNILFGWFALCYGITLFKHAEAATLDKTKESKLIGFVILSVISTILAILFFMAVLSIVMSPAFQSFIKEAGTDKVKQELQQEDNQQDLNVTPALEEATPTPTPIKSVQSAPVQPAASSCTNYNIREGKFASNKCYDAATLADLEYYLSRYDSVVFKINGAVGQANVTCSGFTASFAAQCEQAKKTIADGKAQLDTYTTTIQGLIAKGK